ncbi:hypothetical protein PIIN_07527 [Serendipita indica DSM 11827]|uniref:Uncharacterized protein n=1 Tax=Serendipita indica (strain DSM 11827) TaxID=1109443 RepID=G4TQI2_SERID|nr:hypothetical protein PIIN_07527 [Serendipita indica DSM 11827]
MFLIYLIAYATYPQTLSVHAVRTITTTVPTRTLYAPCGTISTVVSDGVIVSSVYVTVTPGQTTESSSQPASNSTSHSSSNGPIIGGVVGGVVALSALFGVIWYLWRRNKKLREMLKENEEEEKHTTAIDPERLIPSPYTQYPSPSVVGSPTSAGVYSPDVYGLTPEELALTGGAAATQYTPTHSRAGSTSTGFQPRPLSAVTSSAGGGAAGVGAAMSRLPPPSSDGYGSRPGSAMAGEYGQEGSVGTGMSAAASAKAREAYQHRRSALYTQNAEDVGPAGQHDDGDIVMPTNAHAVRSTVPPSAWTVPPPAYTPDQP